MVAGTILLAGKTGSHCGFGMKRGTIIFSNEKPTIPSTFVNSNYNFNSYWGLLASDLKKYHHTLEDISKKEFSRVVGDLAFGGKGEWFYLDK
jgi:formylmethanofuran dehydrogenase subunit C